MKKLHFIIILLMLSGTAPCLSFAQDNFPFVAMNKNDFFNPKKEPGIEDVFVGSNNKVIVKTSEGKKKYSGKEVWGFENKKGKKFRVYKQAAYELLQSDELSVYTRQAVNDVQYYTGYYFSIGNDGDIYEMTEANFNKVFFDSNDKFLSLLKRYFNPLEGYAKYNDKTKSYRIVELYKQSLK